MENWVKKYAKLTFGETVSSVNKKFVLDVANTIKEAINKEYAGVLKVNDISTIHAASTVHEGDYIDSIIFEVLVKVKEKDETAEEKIKRLEEENQKLKSKLKKNDPFGLDLFDCFDELFK